MMLVFWGRLDKSMQRHEKQISKCCAQCGLVAFIAGKVYYYFHKFISIRRTLGCHFTCQQRQIGTRNEGKYVGKVKVANF